MQGILSELQVKNKDLTALEISGILKLILDIPNLTNSELVRLTGIPKETLKQFKKSISMRQLLWYLLAGTRGGGTRIMMIDAIRNKPMNAHQLAQLLRLDYKTIQHHLKVLTENNIFSVIVMKS